MSERLLRLPAVRELTALSRSELYRLVKLGQFPAQVALGQCSVAWRESEVFDWIEARPRKLTRAAV